MVSSFKCIIRFIVLPCLCALWLSLFLNASKPEVKISTIAVSPRLYMIEDDESANWRFWLDYNQNFGYLFKIESRLEYGSQNNRFQHPFRIHDLFARLNLRDHTLKLGRIVHWSSLILSRVDGVEYSLKTDKFGSLKLLGGLPAAIDFNDASYTEKLFFLASWGKGKQGKNIAVSYWMKDNGENSYSFIGSIFSMKLFSKSMLSGSLAWNFDDKRFYHGRFRLNHSLGKHRLMVGIRFKRYLVSESFPWIREEINLSPILTFGLNSSLAREISSWNQIVYRLGDESTKYLRSTLLYKRWQMTVLGGIQGDRTLLGSGFGTVKKLSKSLSIGVNAMVNAIDFSGDSSGEDLFELQKASSLYGWITWQPKPMVRIKLFGQYNNNPYYTIDGRGGLVINVAL